MFYAWAKQAVYRSETANCPQRVGRGIIILTSYAVIRMAITSYKLTNLVHYQSTFINILTCTNKPLNKDLTNYSP